MPIELFVEPRWDRNRVDVTIVSRHPGSPTMIGAFNAVEGSPEALFVWNRVDPDGILPKPTLAIPGEVWDAIKAHVAAQAPATSASARHLDDAIAMRDRFWTIIETAAQLQLAPVVRP